MAIKFADMLKVSIENEEVVATLPAVIEVKTTEGDAPAAAEASAPAEEVVADPAPAAEDDAPCAAECGDTQVGDAEEVSEMIAAQETEEAIAETNAELNAAMSEADTAIEVKQDMDTQVDEQEKILENPETAAAVTPATVAIAQQAFEFNLKSLGINASEIPSLRTVSFENMSNPTQALRIQTEDMKQMASKVWETVKAFFKKVIEIVGKLLGFTKAKIAGIESNAKKLQNAIGSYAAGEADDKKKEAILKTYWAALSAHDNKIDEAVLDLAKATTVIECAKININVVNKSIAAVKAGKLDDLAAASKEGLKTVLDEDGNAKIKLVSGKKVYGIAAHPFFNKILMKFGYVQPKVDDLVSPYAAKTALTALAGFGGVANPVIKSLEDITKAAKDLSNVKEEGISTETIKALQKSFLKLPSMITNALISGAQDTLNVINICVSGSKAK